MIDKHTLARMSREDLISAVEHLTKERAALCAQVEDLRADLALDPTTREGQPPEIYARAIMAALSPAMHGRARYAQMPAWACEGPIGTHPVSGIVWPIGPAGLDHPLMISSMSIAKDHESVKIGMRPERPTGGESITLESSPAGVRRARRIAALYTTPDAPSS